MFQHVKAIPDMWENMQKCKGFTGTAHDGTGFDRCHSFDSGAGLGVNRILNIKRGILRRQGDLSS